MSDFVRQRRFDELDAARALGDLSADEGHELEALVAKEGFETDKGLDWIAAALEADRAPAEEPLDEGLVRELEAGIIPFENPDTERKVVRPIWTQPALGWAAAACLALALLISLNREPASVAAIAPSEARQTLISGGAEPIDFAATAAYPGLAGDVVWSDTGQQGYMSLAGLPANDPAREQYQLWIVDPERDTAPVDGGVFDIPATGGPVVIPVRAALRVDRPVAFVITVEQPGGVVVSKQERVAAIAQRS